MKEILEKIYKKVNRKQKLFITKQLKKWNELKANTSYSQ